MSTRQQVGVGCLMVVAGFVTAGLALTLGGLQGFGSRNAFHAEVRDAAGLSSGSLVSVRGVEVGKVTGLELTDGVAMVHFEVDGEVVVRRTATAAVRARSLLGEKYVALDLGEGDPLPDGSELPPLGDQFEVDELVAVLTPLLEAVDPAAIEQATRALASTLEDDPEVLARMLRDAEGLLRRASAASEELEPLVREGRLAVSEARGAIGVLQARGREAEVLVQRADALLVKLDSAAQPLPQTVEEARATLAEARDLLADVDAALAESEGLFELLGEMDRDGIREVLLEDGVRVRLFKQKAR